MLHVKCPKCDASYKLSEDLYRRKAAGFGVVVTCRHCKAEIHVQDESAPPAAANAEPTTPVADKLPAVAEGTPTATVPRVAPKPVVAPKPGVLPKPSAVPKPGAAPRPGPPRAGTLRGVVPPRPATPAAPEPVTPSPTPTRAKPAAASTTNEGSSPRLVALSPGLLGVGTALKDKPPAASAAADADAAPDSEEPVTQRPPAPISPSDSEDLWGTSSATQDSEIPVASTDFLAEPAPDSATPLDSKDYVEEPPKRLPQAPPVRRIPGLTRATPAKEELPSATSAPKIDSLVHGPPVALTDKKPPPRKQQPSGDVTDDLLSGHLGFDNVKQPRTTMGLGPAPMPLAPPDADALLRPPESQRPPAVVATPTASKPVVETSAPKPAAPKSGGRGAVWLVLLVLLAGSAFAFRDRIPGMHSDARPEPQPEPAAKTEPAPQPAAPTPPPEPATAEPAPEPAPVASTAPETPEPEATTPVPAPVATNARATTPKPSTPAAPHTAAAPKPEPAAKPEPAPKPEPTPKTPSAPPEPRVTGTDPFDAAAARGSLETAAAIASTCRKEGDPSGVAVVTITFSPTGRVTTANIGGPPFAATPTGGCIAATMRKARVPPFAGDMVTVRKTVTIQ